MAATSPGLSSNFRRPLRVGRGAGAGGGGGGRRAQWGAVRLEARRRLAGLLLYLPPPFAVRLRRERRQVRAVQPLPPPDLADVERQRFPVFGFERLGAG